MPMMTEHQKLEIRKREMAERLVEWLRETYGITPYECANSPASLREEIHAAWFRYWSDEGRRVTKSDTRGNDATTEPVQR